MIDYDILICLRLTSNVQNNLRNKTNIRKTTISQSITYRQVTVDLHVDFHFDSLSKLRNQFTVFLHRTFVSIAIANETREMWNEWEGLGGHLKLKTIAIRYVITPLLGEL